MKAAFLDTFYFVALLNTNDKGHSMAIEWTRTFKGPVVTSEWVMLELADALCGTPQRSSFAPLRSRYLILANCRIVPFDNPIYEEAIRLYDTRPDKKWSLTDCTSFIIMRREGLTDALTADHHFEQAGFVPLLKSP